MSYSHHLDGKTIVLLWHVQTWFRNRFEVMLTGRFRYDGRELTIVDEDDNHWLADASLSEKVARVRRANLIGPCDGFDYFAIVDRFPVLHVKRAG